MPEILLENKDFLIINKPAGLVVHSDGKIVEPTLCDFLIEKFPEIKEVGEPLVFNKGLENELVINRPGIVHRLDRETSGAMVVARTKDGFEYLKGLFQNRKVKKTYHAFVYGNIKEDSGIIDSPIARSKNDFRQWFSANELSESAKRNIRGELREAVTEFSVLSRSIDKSVTFVEVRPLTGRTHQIRVHMKSLYHPLVSDSLYAPNREKLLGFDRVALHARKIEFMGQNGEKVSVEAPYPSDFALAVESFSQGLLKTN